MSNENHRNDQHQRNNLIEDDPEDTLRRVSAALTAIGMSLEDSTYPLSTVELQGFGMLILGARNAIDQVRGSAE